MCWLVLSPSCIQPWFQLKWTETVEYFHLERKECRKWCIQRQKRKQRGKIKQGTEQEKKGELSKRKREEKRERRRHTHTELLSPSFLRAPRFFPMRHFFTITWLNFRSYTQIDWIDGALRFSVHARCHILSQNSHACRARKQLCNANHYRAAEELYHAQIIMSAWSHEVTVIT